MLVAVASLLYACGDDDDGVRCGALTVRVGSSCVAEDAGGSTMAGAGGSKPPPVTCGAGTKLENGKCVAVDAGTTEPPPAKNPVGSACETDDDCEAPTTCLISDSLPGGMCTVVGCTMDNPCPTGSVCNRVTKGFNICFPYCDQGTDCRKSEGYMCQPLYTNALNICAPPCTVSKACSSGTNCNEDTGLCELAGCDPNAETSECDDTQVCWPDTRGLTEEGGLCLRLCDPDDPKKTCKVDERDEVCQPLADDPANSGFCAPPVCSKTEECPAGAVCQSSVCQPPALCDDNGACADESTTCVSGKCMPKCPAANDGTCADLHPGLVCADVLDVPACLPKGSFPGSPCRANRDDACSPLAVGDDSAPMVCQDDVCLVDCGEGGQDLCTAVKEGLICAAGIFDDDLCLPAGAFPGGPCGENDSCAQDLQGNDALDMKCVSDTCVVDCDESDEWPGYGDALCAILDPSLTCAGAAGDICVRACAAAGACDSGYSCLDPGSLPDHENACLPTGSFPGSPCATGDTCSPLGGGINQVCASGTCVVACDTAGDAAADDALCAGIDASLTCSESAGNICVLRCDAGACDAGYSCLNPGTEDACLPTGSFPGSPCAAGNTCAALSSGPTQSCVNDVCVVNCGTSGDAAADDAVCTAVSPLLTCSESAGDLCVLHCSAGACLSGYSCLDPSGENACLPTGSFPGSPCRTSGTTVCDPVGAAPQVCVDDTCVVDCTTGGDATCTAVSPLLTCSETAENICVFACDAGACPTGYSCFDPGNENACLPDGSFPGSTCRDTVGDECDDLEGGLAEQVCVESSNVCAINCAVTGSAIGNDGFCSAVGDALGADLTCSETADNICVVACDQNGACPTGYSCIDPGGENACLPNGTFPGSMCRTSGTACDPVGAATQVCVDDTCVVDCTTGGDTLCGAIDSDLTCSETADNICVFACDNTGACPQGYSCFAPGGENACLPDGTFPGSACRATVGDECDQNLDGNESLDMACSGGTCAIKCETGGTAAQNDGFCAAIGAGSQPPVALTCSESAQNICVFECDVQGGCPTGYSCLNPGSENACLPNGSFPGSACATGDTCGTLAGGALSMKCVSNTCAVDCAQGGNATCTAVSAALTCSAAAGDLCVVKCQSGVCPADYSCLLAGVEDECLPTGSFPSSPCRAANPKCDSDLKGIAEADLSCIDPGTGQEACLLPCAGDDDALCTSVDSTLTCFSTVNLCVLKCQEGQCPPGYTCNTSFPGDGDICLPSP